MTEGSKSISTIALFASLYVTISLIPGFPIIGGRGKIEIAAFLSPLYGIFLGPLNGAIASWLGAFLAWILPPGTPKPWGLALTLASASAALVSGYNIYQKNFNKIKGWILATLVLLTLIFLWYLSPVGRLAYWYPIPHIFAVFTSIIGGKYALRFLRKHKYIPLALLLIGYPGIMADHMVGNLLFIYLGKYLLGLAMEPEKMASLFLAVLPVSIMERGLMVIILVALGTPITYGLMRAKLLKY